MRLIALILMATGLLAQTPLPSPFIGGGGGGGGTPGGSTTQCQYNNSGAFGGITGCTTNGTAVTLVAPALGTPTALVLTNATGLPAAAVLAGTFGAGSYTISSNLTVSGHTIFEGVTSTGATGAGKLVYDGTPTLVTPNIGAATGTSLATTSIVGNNDSGGTLLTQPTNTGLYHFGSNGRITSGGIANPGFFSSARWDGTVGSPTAVQSGEQIGGYNSWAYDGATLIGPLGSFRCFANQTQSVGAGGTYCEVATTPNGSTTIASAMRWQATGGVTLPSTVTGGDKGAGTLNATGLYQANVQVATLSGTEALTNKTYNGNTFTAGTGILTIAAAKTLTASNTLTLAGTDSTTMTFPTTSATIARTDAANTFTGVQTMTNAALTTPTVSQINDANGLAYVKSVATASAVDELTITNGATGNPGTVTLSATGSDSNVHLKLASKGTGQIMIPDASACGTTGGVRSTASANNGFFTKNGTNDFTICVGGSAGLNITGTGANGGTVNIGTWATGQTLTVLGPSAGGGNSNRTGTNIALATGLGTGSGVAGYLDFLTDTALTSGTTIHTYTSRMRIGDVSLTGTTVNFKDSLATTGATRVNVDLGAADSSSTVTLNNAGTTKAQGYQSADGTTGATTTCTILSITSITVKNGLVTGCS